MRAKLINEIQNFERGSDPKRSIGLGYPNWESLRDGDYLEFSKIGWVDRRYLKSEVSCVTFTHFKKDQIIKICSVLDAGEDKKLIQFKTLLNFKWTSSEIFQLIISKDDFFEYFKPIRRGEIV